VESRLNEQNISRFQEENNHGNKDRCGGFPHCSPKEEMAEKDMYKWRYEALRRGRHPRSFPSSAHALWQRLNVADWRKSQVRGGRSLDDVVSGVQLHPFSSQIKLWTPVEERPETAAIQLARTYHEGYVSRNQSDLNRKMSEFRNSHNLVVAQKNRPRKRLAPLKSHRTAATNLSEKLSGFESLSTFLLRAKRLGHDKRNQQSRNFLDLKEIEAATNHQLRYNHPQKKSNPDMQHVSFLPTSADSKMFFGTRIALQAADGSFLCAAEPKGEFSFQSYDEEDIQVPQDQDDEDGRLEKNEVTRVNVKPNHVIMFTLLNLNDPSYIGPVMAGDDCWLCIHPGRGQVSWRDGSVVGTRPSEGASIDTFRMTAEGVERREKLQMSQESIGKVTPILAHIPRLPGQKRAERSMDEIFRDTKHLDAIQRMNRAALHLGQWRLQFVDLNSESSAPLFNGAKVFLTQDWFALQNEASKAVLKTIPDKRDGVFTIRIEQSITTRFGNLEKGSAKQHLLMRARSQLKGSELLRKGCKKYAQSLQSGESFSDELRNMRQKAEQDIDRTFIEPIDIAESNSRSYFFEKFQQISPLSPSSPVGLLDPAQENWKCVPFQNDSFLNDTSSDESENEEKPAFITWYDALDRIREEDSFVMGKVSRITQAIPSLPSTLHTISRHTAKRRETALQHPIGGKLAQEDEKLNLLIKLNSQH